MADIRIPKQEPPALTKEQLISENERLSRELKQAKRALKFESDKLAHAQNVSDTNGNLAEVLKGEQARQGRFMNMLMANASDIIVLLDDHLRLAYCSNRFLNLLGVSDLAKVRGRKLIELREFFDDQAVVKQILSNIRKALHSRLPVNFDTRAQVRYGLHAGTADLAVTIRVARDESAKMVGVVAVAHDVTDLNAAKNQAEQANRAKSEFLASVSHELRTPLNAVNGLAELELRKNLPRETLNNLEKIYSSGVTLLNIINDILDVSKIDSGKFSLVPDDYDIASVISDTVSMNIVRLGSKPIKLTLHVDPDLPRRLYGDGLRIKQIMNNLLSNAIKYTDEGEVTLNLSARRAGKDCWLNGTVSDTGIGIKAEDVPKLFSDYQRLDLRHNHKISGTGLGLSLTKQLVNMMDGVISVESTYGEGSTFRFRIRQGVIDDAPIGLKLAGDLQSFRLIEDAKHRIKQLDYVHIPQARVLVVDDVITNLDVAKGMLEPYQMTIHSVTSGQQAIERVRLAHTHYDLILMDHMMPDMDGLEAVQAIRALPGSYAAQVPIVALTANAVPGIKELFLEGGCQDFLTKPIDVAELDRVIHTWILDREPPEVKGQILTELDQRRLTGGPHIASTQLGSATGTASPSSATVDSVIAPTSDAQDLNMRTFLQEEQVEGLDMVDGLSRFNGSLDIYLRVIHSFCRNVPAELEDLQKRLSADNLEAYAVVVHGVKGSCYGIGAKAAGDVAKELEVAAKAGDMAAVKARTPAFLVQVDDLLKALNRLESHYDAQVESQQEAALSLAERPDPQLLQRLYEATCAYDIEGMQKALEELLDHRYQQGADLVAWLRDAVAAFSYDAIIARLAEFAKI